MGAPDVPRALWTLAITSVLLGGCYTVFVHPKIEPGSWGRGELRAACIDCHPDYNIYPYDPYDYYFGANYFWDHPQYGYYYGYPSWWEDYYWDYYYSASDQMFWHEHIAYGGYGYYDYYRHYPPIEPDDTEPIREAGAPDYHGPLPKRPAIDTLTELERPDSRLKRDLDSAGEAFADTVRIREAPELKPAPNTKRTAGQPPHSRPTGWWGAKPPRLRQVTVEMQSKVRSEPGGAAKGNRNSDKSSSSSKSDSDDDKDKKKKESKEEDKDEKPAETERRGRPKRGPP